MNLVNTYSLLNHSKLIDLKDKTWYEKGISRTRGGKTSKYTELLESPCDDFALRYSGLSSKPFDSSNLTVLTSGTCGSACGMLTKLLQLTNNARVVTIGGLLRDKKSSSTSNMEVASYHGASVEKLSALIEQYNSCQQRKIEPFRYGEEISIASVELYPWSAVAVYDKTITDTSIPLEFTHTPADIHLWIWDYTINNRKIYDAVLAIIEKCSLSQKKVDIDGCSSRSNIKHGVYGRPCDATTGKYDTTKCILIRCEIGFYLSNQQCISLSESQDQNIPLNNQSYRRYQIVVLILSIILAVSLLFIIIQCALMIYRRPTEPNSFKHSELHDVWVNE
jgi:hypothetical protein